MKCNQPIFFTEGPKVSATFSKSMKMDDECSKAVHHNDPLVRPWHISMFITLPDHATKAQIAWDCIVKNIQ